MLPIYIILGLGEYSIKKIFKNQNKFNRNTTALVMGLTIYAVLTGLHNRKQDGKIEDLRNRIKELKCMKGD